MHYDCLAQKCKAWRQFPFRCSVAEILERLNLVMGRGMNASPWRWTDWRINSARLGSRRDMSHLQTLQPAHELCWAVDPLPWQLADTPLPSRINGQHTAAGYTALNYHSPSHGVQIELTTFSQGFISFINLTL